MCSWVFSKAHVFLEVSSEQDAYVKPPSGDRNTYSRLTSSINRQLYISKASKLCGRLRREGEWGAAAQGHRARKRAGRGLAFSAVYCSLRVLDVGR